MSIERTFYCDAPDCERHASTAATHLPFGFLKVSGRDEPTLYFCGWDCVLKYGARLEPEEIVDA